jgi:hypothetical protein
MKSKLSELFKFWKGAHKICCVDPNFDFSSERFTITCEIEFDHERWVVSYDGKIYRAWREEYSSYEDARKGLINHFMREIESVLYTFIYYYCDKMNDSFVDVKIEKARQILDDLRNLDDNTLEF